MRWFVWGTITIGGVLGGVLGSVLGVRATMIIDIAGAALAVVPVLFSRVRGIREMPALADEEASAGDGLA